MDKQISALRSIDFTDPHLKSAGYQGPLENARAIVTYLNEDSSRIRQLGQPAFHQLLASIQRLAYINPDTGYDISLAEWVERQHAGILQHSKDDLESHSALGRSWLLKAQSSLAKIEAEDIHSASQVHEPGATNTLRARTGAGEDAERIDSSDYVQARDMLRASIEHLDKALAVSHRQRKFSGHTLELAAEAYIHLGNVTGSRNNERFYQRALHLLQMASELEDYDMDQHLEEFLDQNAEFISSVTEPWYTSIRT